MKKTKFYVGLTLCIQASSFILLFLMLCIEKKSLRKALLAVALASGVTGLGLLLVDSSEDLKERKEALMKKYEDYDPFADDESDEVEICGE